MMHTTTCPDSSNPARRFRTIIRVSVTGDDLDFVHEASFEVTDDRPVFLGLIGALRPDRVPSTCLGH